MQRVFGSYVELVEQAAGKAANGFMLNGVIPVKVAPKLGDAEIAVAGYAAAEYVDT